MCISHIHRVGLYLRRISNYHPTQRPDQVAAEDSLVRSNGFGLIVRLLLEISSRL